MVVVRKARGWFVGGDRVCVCVCVLKVVAMCIRCILVISVEVMVRLDEVYYCYLFFSSFPSVTQAQPQGQATVINRKFL